MKKLFIPVFFALICGSLLWATPTPSYSSSSAEVKTLVKNMGLGQMLIDQMTSEKNTRAAGVQILAKINKANPGQEEKIFNVFSDSYRETLVAILPDFESYALTLIAEEFTPAEIEQMITFYKTPTAQRMLKSIISEKVEMPSADDLMAMNAFLQTDAGKKFQSVLPDMMHKLNARKSYLMKTKQRPLLYSRLRQELPKYHLKVPEPFEPTAPGASASHP